ncbi:hypothetical protein [Aliiroseovarius crassostreae]|uniref:hypothetical protein n=1 Tax=Aliiroseovarius crassostreae TaxID=154981 RepID=UPI00220DDCF9|nr:hypothetical protein [Aliiroseovarius crassostreae]UWQ05941.1 hypothetical protein K3X22_05790 [Aliiroseovarius crassostreae]
MIMPYYIANTALHDKPERANFPVKTGENHIRKRPIPQIKIPPRAEVEQISKRFGAVAPWTADDPQKFGYIEADLSLPKWRGIKGTMRSYVSGAVGLSLEERTILLEHLHFAKILINPRGAYFWTPSAVAMRLLTKATGKSTSTMKRHRAKLIQRGLLAPVKRRRFDGNKRMVVYALNIPGIRSLQGDGASQSLERQIKRSIETLRKPDAFRDMHPSAMHLYLTLLEQPKLTNAKLAAKLRISTRTVNRIKADMVKAGAMRQPDTKGQPARINPDFYRRTEVEVLEDLGGSEMGQSLGQTVGQSAPKVRQSLGQVDLLTYNKAADAEFGRGDMNTARAVGDENANPQRLF